MELVTGLKADTEGKSIEYSSDIPRIIITGCPLGGVADKIIPIIEENGAIVVCYENCSGIKEKKLI